MMLRGLIIGIAVWIPATVFAGASWSQSQTNRVKASSGGSSSSSIDYSNTPSYTQEIRQSLERLNSGTERLAVGQILDELDTKSNREILVLKFAPDVCQEIACRAVSPDTAHRYVAAYADARVAEDAHRTALWSVLIAAATASVSLLSLLISVLSYRRTVRPTESATPA